MLNNYSHKPTKRANMYKNINTHTYTHFAAVLLLVAVTESSCVLAVGETIVVPGGLENLRDLF